MIAPRGALFYRGASVLDFFLHSAKFTLREAMRIGTGLELKENNFSDRWPTLPDPP